MATMQQVSADTVCAGFVDRLIAVIIDAVILIIPNFIINLVIGGPIAIILQVLLGSAYAIYFWTNSGQTPGKKVMKLKVVKADGGGLLDMGGAVTRVVGTWISGIAIGLGYLWVIWDPKHEAWHDKIAKTKVIKVDA